MRKIAVALGVCVLGASAMAAPTHAAGTSCWGEASAVFAQTGDMGTHSAGQATPRVGLRNLARALFDAGLIPDDSMESLGVFVSNELGLTIDACS